MLLITMKGEVNIKSLDDIADIDVRSGAVVTENGKEIKYVSPNNRVWEWEDKDNPFTFDTPMSNWYKNRGGYRVYNHNKTFISSHNTRDEATKEAAFYTEQTGNRAKIIKENGNGF